MGPKTEVGITTYCAMVADLTSLRPLVFTKRACRLTTEKVMKRFSAEGESFLTKTLPQLGKALDSALLSNKLTIPAGFKKLAGTEIPMLFGELFSLLFHSSGDLRVDADPRDVRILRTMLLVFYKYALPSSNDQNTATIDLFKIVDESIPTRDVFFSPEGTIGGRVVAKAKDLLSQLFRTVNLLEIMPRHGPGAVSEGYKYNRKNDWSCLPDKLLSVYSYEYFTSCYTELGERLQELQAVSSELPTARVILVPKDSRGPRLISSEPAVNQWIQQGIMRKLVEVIEAHPLTKGRVNFTDQSINGRLALLASANQEYATLDLKEASDRVPHCIVQELFPDHIYRPMEACRTEYTTLPCGKRMQLNKWAPMGSALCFPVLALIAWVALTTAGVDDVYVYGDDIVVPTTQVVLATKALEMFNFQLNPHKCCASGFFRESCGVDAFKGVDVTPLRIRKVWTVSNAAEQLYSWVAYCNSLYNRGFIGAANAVADRLERIYGPIRDDQYGYVEQPCFSFERLSPRPKKRWNRHLQRYETKIAIGEGLDVRPGVPGYHKLLRFFEGAGLPEPTRAFKPFEHRSSRDETTIVGRKDLGSYTQRRRMKLRYRWA